MLDLYTHGVYVDGCVDISNVLTTCWTGPSYGYNLICVNREDWLGMTELQHMALETHAITLSLTHEQTLTDLENTAWKKNLDASAQDNIFLDQDENYFMLGVFLFGDIFLL